jgi:predicted esterase YcpF (UPF0227 family)
VSAIVYLHGFLSSPASAKASQLGEYLRRHAPDVAYRVPALPHRPALAVDRAAAEVGALGGEPLLVGSSLGGFYATVLAERLGCRAVVINPAVHPQRLFSCLQGPQRNPYTGEAFELSEGHLAELRALDPLRITQPDRYWLLAETGDDVLDYREAVAYYAGASQNVAQGGDHSLQGFAGHLPGIVAWAREPRQEGRS